MHEFRSAIKSSRLMRAYRGESQTPRPVWFMRQAGRSLPEYRAARSGIPMLDACLIPDLAAEITVQPVRRHHVDAAIFFSDIVVPLKLAGLDVEIVPGRGPVFAHPVRTHEQILALINRSLDDVSGALDVVAKAVAAACAALPEEVPLIGFAGAPFTLATYLVEGGPSKDHLRTRALMHTDPEGWQLLMHWLAELTIRTLRVQIAAGATAVQIFDSWAGALSLADYEQYVAPATAQIIASLSAGSVLSADDALSAGSALLAESVPCVLFGVGTQHLLPAMCSTGASVIGVDYRTPLDVANVAVGGHLPLQGNIDPALLTAPWSILTAHVDDVLRRGSAAPSHIVNLGHGVPADTDPDVLTRLVEYIHAK